MGREENIIRFYVLCNRLKDVIKTWWKDWHVKRVRLESGNVDSNVAEDWLRFVDEQSVKDLKEVIAEENFKFMDNDFRDDAIKIIITDIDKILPPMSLFGERAQKKQIVFEKLNKYFEKYEVLI